VAIDLSTDRIYWANQGNHTISYAKLDGSGGGGQLNISGTTTLKPHGLAIDPMTGRIYWPNGDNNTVSYANLDGSGGNQLNTTGATPADPYGAAIDPEGGRIFWADRASSSISYANLDGSGGGPFNISGSTPEDIHGVAIDRPGGRIYWANFHPSDGSTTISFANLDGSGGGGELNLNGSTPSGAVGLAIDHQANRLYFGNLGNDTISYVNLDGSGGGGELNLSGATSSDPRFVALLRSPSGTGAPQMAGGPGAGSVLTCSPGTWAPDLQGAYLYHAPQSIAYQWSRNGTDIVGATDTSYTPFAPGEYRCREIATNEAGSTSQMSDPHTVSAPSATITHGPKDKTKKKKATFKFTGSDATALAGFQCSLDGAPFVACASPYAVKVKKGRHTFQVEAIDRAGNVSSPATDDWTVKKKRLRAFL
jgi:hypothetical protein